MSDDIPQWAKERAAQLANGSRSADRPLREQFPSDCDHFPHMHAFARYISEHEDNPVSADVVAMRYIIAASWEAEGYNRRASEIREGRDDDRKSFQAALIAYRRHKEMGK